MKCAENSNMKWPGNTSYRFKAAYLPFIFLILFAVVSICLLGVYGKSILQVLVRLAEYIKGAGAWGALLMFLCLLAVNYPTVPGNTTILMIIGFVYGSRGFLLAYVGGLVGAILSYAVACRMMRGHRHTWIADYPKYSGMLRAIEFEGFKLVLLLRLAPYPWGIMNWILAAGDVRFDHFFLATAISLFKFYIPVAIGESLPALSDIATSRTKGSYEIVFLVTGIIFGIGVCIYVYKATQAAIERHSYL
eukprot:Ihof_evm10s38 gene=Ihof_evmTU10s38